jgi:hypothetical protein
VIPVQESPNWIGVFVYWIAIIPERFEVLTEQTRPINLDERILVLRVLGLQPSDERDE